MDSGDRHHFGSSTRTVQFAAQIPSSVVFKWQLKTLAFALKSFNRWVKLLSIFKLLLLYFCCTDVTFLSANSESTDLTYCGFQTCGWRPTETGSLSHPEGVLKPIKATCRGPPTGIRIWLCSEALLVCNLRISLPVSFRICRVWT